MGFMIVVFQTPLRSWERGEVCRQDAESSE